MFFFFFLIWSLDFSAHWSTKNNAMPAAEPQEGSADAFSIMMRPLTSDDSIISPASIGRNDGSLEDPMATDTCPDFS
jgi:hypothetical protein